MWQVESGRSPPCPFCRTPASLTIQEAHKSFEKRVQLEDSKATFIVAFNHLRGVCGSPKNQEKAQELLVRAVELGETNVHNTLGLWCNGMLDEVDGCIVDEKKARYHLELAAIGGNIPSRNHIGFIEYNSGNIDRSMKHVMIAAAMGDDAALKNVRQGYAHGNIAKDEFLKTLRAWKESTDEMKSEERDKVATAAPIPIEKVGLNRRGEGRDHIVSDARK